MRSRLLLHSIALVPAVLVLLLIWNGIDYQGGEIGHDFAHQLYRLILGADHFWKNPFSAFHFTAALCGGVAQFADPQSMYYSLPQLLSFWIDPFLASRITIIVSYVLGYWGFYVLLKRLFNIDFLLSHLGALLFICNGFSFANLFVGHLTHFSYLLFPWFLYLLLAPFPAKAKDFSKRAIGLSLLVSLTFYAGGLHVILVFACSAVAISPYLVYRHWSYLMRWLGLIATSVALVFLSCLGKLLATAHYAHLFAAPDFNLSQRAPWEAILQYFWFIPERTTPYENFGSFAFGAWEYVAFLPRITLPLLILSPWFLLSNKSKALKIVVGLSSALCLELCAIGLGLGGNDYLPFFAHYHNPIKLLGGLIPLIIIVSVLFLEKIKQKLSPQIFESKRKHIFFLVIALGLVGEFYYSGSFFVSQKIGISFGYSDSFFATIREHNSIPTINQIYDRTSDWGALAHGGSSLRCYEPLLGYGLEKMQSKLVPGPSAQIRDHYFNVNHPGCLVYPEFYNCKDWDRIPEANSQEFNSFIQGQDAFEIPFWQTAADWFSGFFMAASVIAFLFISLAYRRRPYP